MKKFLFIGIDFSKSKFDVTVLKSIDQQDFAQAIFLNEKQGFNEFLKWVTKQSNVPKQDWLFCGEHTGLYSQGLTDFLIKKKLFIWLENRISAARIRVAN